jgi:hypothetical protein
MRTYLLPTAAGGAMLLATVGFALAWSDVDCRRACQRAPGSVTVAQCIQFHHCDAKRGQPTEGTRAVNKKVRDFNRRAGRQ